jgi:hypothetical protein
VVGLAGGMSVCYGVMCICVGVVSAQVIASLKSKLLFTFVGIVGITP